MILWQGTLPWCSERHLLSFLHAVNVLILSQKNCHHNQRMLTQLFWRPSSRMNTAGWVSEEDEEEEKSLSESRSSRTSDSRDTLRLQVLRWFACVVARERMTKAVFSTVAPRRSTEKWTRARKVWIRENWTHTHRKRNHVFNNKETLTRLRTPKDSSNALHWRCLQCHITKTSEMGNWLPDQDSEQRFSQMRAALKTRCDKVPQAGRWVHGHLKSANMVIDAEMTKLKGQLMETDTLGRRWKELKVKDSSQTWLRSGPQENAQDPRNQTREASSKNLCRAWDKRRTRLYTPKRAVETSSTTSTTQRLLQRSSRMSLST